MQFHSHEARTEDLLREAVFRGRRRAARWVRRGLAAIRAPRVSEGELRRAMHRDAFEAPLEFFENHASCGIFTGLRVPAENAALLNRAFPESSDSIVSQAERILAGEFPIFGEWVALGHDPNWHADWTTGYRWPLEHFTRLSWIDSKDRGEVKLVWELGRLGHLLTLFVAFAVTSDHRFANEALRQLEHFEESNPLEFGVHWLSPMQVSLRLINLSLMAWFLRQFPPFGDSQFRNYLSLVLGHARYVRHNLEFSFLGTSNHYFSNVAALAVAARTFPHFICAEEWLAFGSREIESELEKQIYPDGFQYESSFGYHRLVTELAVLSFGMMADDDRWDRTLPACSGVDGIPDIDRDLRSQEEARRMRAVPVGSEEARRMRALPGGSYDTLGKMLDAIRQCRTPSGTLPNIGDSDDTRVLCFVPEPGEREELDALLGAGARLAREEEFQAGGAGTATELFLCGPRRCSSEHPAALRAETAAEPLPPSLHTSRITLHSSPAASAAFPHAGIFVQRHGELFAIIDAGENGINGRGSHAHNDALSFSLGVGRTDFLIDPGTFLYTGSEKWRNAFRSASWHNTVVVDGQEQNRMFSGRLFELGEDARVTLFEWSTGDDEDVFDAQHAGYERLDEPVTHRRRLVLDKRGRLWRLADQLTGAGRHALEFVFHFAPECMASIQPDQSIVVQGAETSLHVIPRSALALNVKLEERWVSRRFNSKTPSHAAVYSCETVMPAEAEFLLVPSVSRPLSVEHSGTGFSK